MSDRAPTYVKALRRDLAEAHADLAAAAEALTALRVYLASPKFTAEWPTRYAVNPQDVLDRLPHVYAATVPATPASAAAAAYRRNAAYPGMGIAADNRADAAADDAAWNGGADL